jgi:broad specificity phosphatase PhoE
MSFMPAKIVILRHGEKTDDAGDVNLSVRGYSRAGALAPALPAAFGKPDFLFATQASADSNRPVETITPLAQSLSLTIDSKHADKDYGKVAEDLLSNSKYQDKFVVICWHHGKIPDLASALGVTPPQNPWPGEVFDRYWVLNRSGEIASVENQPQQLLYGDSAT